MRKPLTFASMATIALAGGFTLWMIRESPQPAQQSVGAIESAAVVTAQKIRPCRPNDVPCDPPAMFVYASRPAPFNALVQFGGSVTRIGETRWLWIKAGEPPEPCTPQQAGDGASYEKACAARIGDVLYTLPPFVIVE